MKQYVTLALAAMMTLSLVACSSTTEPTPDTTEPSVTTPQDVTIDLEALTTEIESKVELPALGLADELLLQDSFGLAAGDVEESVVRIPMMAVTATEYGIFKGDADVIAAALAQRMAGLEATWATYLPDQYDLVLNYSTYTQGDYTMYVIAPEADKQYFENAFLRAFDPSIQELVPAASFKSVTAQVVAVGDNGITVLVDDTYTIEGTYAEGNFIDHDPATGETYVPAVGDLVDMAFDTAVVDDGSEVLQGDIIFLGVSVLALEPSTPDPSIAAPDMEMDMGLATPDMGVGAPDMDVTTPDMDGAMDMPVATLPMN